ncbi:MAG: FtsX-like permease family protein [Bacteroidia bacterium]|nr:FtsX-like permease family protein [Bacteroidia bacterium]
MLKYEIKIAIRKLLKNKLYSSINIIGLAVGVAACLLVATIVLDDLSYDRQWKQTDQLFRIIQVANVNNGTEEIPNVYTGLGPELKGNFPEVKSFCRMEVKGMEFKFEKEKEAVKIPCLLAETTIWDLLDLTIIDGNPRHFIEKIDNVLITEKIKNQYFKDINPIGKTIYRISENMSDTCIISGVIKDIPNNTHLRSQVIVLRYSLKGTNPDFNKLTDGESVATMPQYLLLNPHVNTMVFQKKLNAWYKKVSNEMLSKNLYYLQPIQDVYLRSNYSEPEGIHGSISAIYIYALIAVLILAIACINYVNLSMAKSIDRIRETGISRVVGAKNVHIISRFLLESILFFLMAFGISITLYLIFLPFIEQYLGHQMSLTLLSSLKLFLLTVFILFLVCIVTGFYPSYMLSKIKPVLALKGKADRKNGIGFLRKALIVIQFTIALIVLIAAITINLQFSFLKKADIGYDKENLLEIGFTPWRKSGESFKRELLQIPGIESASIATWYPTYGAGLMTMETTDPRNHNDKLRIGFIDCDLDFPKTLKLQLRDGRAFDAQHPADAGQDSLHYTRVMISDMYSDIFKVTQMDKPVEEFRHIPIGIIKDFHNQSLLEKKSPLILTGYKELEYGAMLVRVSPGTSARIIDPLRKIWKEYYPAQNLSFNWVEDLLAAQYRNEYRLSNVFKVFTFLAIFLACLGLFGLVTFMLEKRMKEIGIRKVLGASVSSISKLVSKDFLKLVIIAILIASPIAWYYLNKWLQNYPYRISVYWWIFIFAAILVLSVTIITISIQAVRAAIINPVRSIQAE